LQFNADCPIVVVFQKEEGISLSLKTAKHSMAAMTVAAVGVVYGDIGTSPLYTMKAVFGEGNGLALIPENILGIVSLIIWGLILVVGLKYVYLMLKADNRGEGGILALLALVHTSLPKGRPLWYRILLLMGVFGASLFYGDSVITPAISVLSAMEGFEVATPFFKPYVVPLAIVILVILYSVQSKGTEGIAKWVGPLMLLWFTSLAVMGIINIIRAPVILQAINPWFAVKFIKASPGIAFIALGAIVLALTGAEALYADMGHFGPMPIRYAWFFIVFPALAINYMGQGGLLIANPAAIVNPFFQQLGAALFGKDPAVIDSEVHERAGVAGPLDEPVREFQPALAGSVEYHLRAGEGGFAVADESDDFFLVEILEHAGNKQERGPGSVHLRRPFHLKHIPGNRRLAVALAEHLSPCLDDLRQIAFNPTDAGQRFMQPVIGRFQPRAEIDHVAFRVLFREGCDHPVHVVIPGGRGHVAVLRGAFHGALRQVGLQLQRLLVRKVFRKFF